MVLGYFRQDPPVAPDPMVVRRPRSSWAFPRRPRRPPISTTAIPKRASEAARKLLKEAKLPETDENIFIAACCEEKGITFLKGEATVRRPQEREEGRGRGGGSQVLVLRLHGHPSTARSYAGLSFRGRQGAWINGQSFRPQHRGRHRPGSRRRELARSTHYVEAPLARPRLKARQKPGDKVAEGREMVLVLESIEDGDRDQRADLSGVVEDSPVAQGQKVQQPATLLAKIAH